MTSLDMSLPVLDRSHQHNTYYLNAENLSQPFSSFSSGRLDVKKKQDAQQSSAFQSATRAAPSSGYTLPEGQEPAVAPQPSPSILTSSLKRARSRQQGDKRRGIINRPSVLDVEPSEGSSPNEGPFSGKGSDLEDYQDPGSSSTFASPSASSDTSEFADCQSEANSLTSSQEDEMEEGLRSLNPNANGTSTANPWAQKLEDEQEKRMAAEEAALKLRQEQAQLHMELQLLKQQAKTKAKLSEAPAPSKSFDKSTDIIVARTVAAIFARVVAADEVAQQWQGEVELLQRRMARMARMEDAIERQRQRDRAARDTLQRRLLHGALAVGCVGAGALAAYMAVRWLQSPARSAQPDLSLLPDALLEADMAVGDSDKVQGSRQAHPLAYPVVADPLPDVSRSYVSTADAPSPQMMSTAEILQQAESLQAKAEGAMAGVQLPGMDQRSVMGAASAFESRLGLASLAPSIFAAASQLY